MISKSLKSEVEAYFRASRVGNPVFRGAHEGRIGAPEMSRYLVGIRYLIHQSLIHIALARREAEKRGLTELAAFFAEKHTEEDGHEAWAEEDLRRLSKKFGLQAGEELVPAATRLASYVESVIRRAPDLYLGYVFFAEYFTVLAVPPFLRDLESKCKIPPSMMSVLGKHAELDRDHALDDLSVIDRLVPAASGAQILGVVRDAIQLYVAFCEEVVAAERSEVRRAA